MLKPIMRYLLALVALLATSEALASTILAVPEDDLARRADVIALVTIIDTQTSVNQRGQVFTLGRVQVLLPVKGVSLHRVATMQVPGGRLPSGLVAETFGAPKLAPGQLWFGFFEAAGDGTLRPLGLSYGLLHTRKDAQGHYWVWRDSSGMALIQPDGSAAPPSVTQLSDTPLEVLVRRVRGYLGLPDARPEGEIGSTPGVLR